MEKGGRITKLPPEPTPHRRDVHQSKYFGSHTATMDKYGQAPTDNRIYLEEVE